MKMMEGIMKKENAENQLTFSLNESDCKLSQVN